MDKLKFFESYIAAVQTGSLTAAARMQNISQPAISQQISALESAYATKLLNRARNGVTTTKAGSVFFERAEAILKEHRELEEDLVELVDGVSGEIKVSTSVALSQFIMMDVVTRLRDTWPDLKIVLSSEDRLVDLVSEKFDLAIRAGSLGHENAIGRKFGTIRTVLVASPSYLDQTIRPCEPDDLHKLNYIRYRADDDILSMPLECDEGIIHAPIKSDLTAQLPALVFQALDNGMGYAKAPYFMVAEAIQEGTLELLLPDYQSLTKDLFLIYPHHESSTHRMRVFLRALFERLSLAPGIDVLPSALRDYTPSSGESLVG